MLRSLVIFALFLNATLWFQRLFVRQTLDPQLVPSTVNLHNPFCAAFVAGGAAEGLMGDFSVHTVETVQDVSNVFEAVVGFFGAVLDLGICSDVVVATVAEEDADTYVLLHG